MDNFKSVHLLSGRFFCILYLELILNKYDMDFHDLKDVVMIYSSGNDGKPSYEWEHANIAVWDPKMQRKGKLIFTGSSKPANEINFNIEFEDDLGPSVIEAFDEVLNKMKETNFDTSINWKIKFLESMLKYRREEVKND